MKSALRPVIFSTVVILVLLFLLLNIGGKREKTDTLLFYCAAGMKAPVEAAAKQYEAEYGIAIQLQYGGSGTLLSSLEVSGVGDL